MSNIKIVKHGLNVIRAVLHHHELMTPGMLHGIVWKFQNMLFEKLSK